MGIRELSRSVLQGLSGEEHWRGQKVDIQESALRDYGKNQAVEYLDIVSCFRYFPNQEGHLPVRLVLLCLDSSRG